MKTRTLRLALGVIIIVLSCEHSQIKSSDVVKEQNYIYGKWFLTEIRGITDNSIIFMDKYPRNKFYITLEKDGFYSTNQYNNQIRTASYLLEENKFQVIDSSVLNKGDKASIFSIGNEYTFELKDSILILTIGKTTPRLVKQFVRDNP